MSQVSSGDLGGCDPCVDLPLELVETGAEATAAGWHRGQDLGQAGAEDAIVDPGGEQGGSQPEIGELVPSEAHVPDDAGLARAHDSGRGASGCTSTGDSGGAHRPGPDAAHRLGAQPFGFNGLGIAGLRAQTDLEMNAGPRRVAIFRESNPEGNGRNALDRWNF